MGLPPWGSIISLSLSKRKQCRIQESHFAWKWKQLSWMAKLTAAVHLWEYLFNDTLSESSSRKKSDFSKFYKYFTSIAVKSILLRNAVFIVLFHLIQFPSWNKTMLSTWIFITNTSMILPPLSIKKKLFSKWNGRHCQELIIWIHFFALTQKLCYIQVVRLLFALVFKPWKKQEVSPLTT